MTELVLPYKNIDQHTIISVEPYQMNSDIKINMKINLKNKVEKKCNRYGFVDKVHRIVELDEGVLSAENLSGNAIYPVTYHCRMCIPIDKTLIISKISILNKELIVSLNGPIRTFIPKTNINTDEFEIVNEQLIQKKTKKLVDVGEHIKILLLNHRINKGSKEINSIGFLQDIATPDEVDTYFNFEETIPGSTSIFKPEDSDDEESEKEEQTGGESNFIF